ncbi:alpha-L-fucosidase [Microbacterium sp. H1-D42]|uniref:alpha-L-fucosidase n=1 Tax=Microbacterium sp. H1-D42 TaxID=2925844 RepID=UPI001F53D6A1|nr:alpha-L-fucosidase [Microbacterium sp. H1-D42]UNK70620.1 alpha-L-fucosidase [Microbacterium sp. H1-D42]
MSHRTLRIVAAFTAALVIGAAVTPAASAAETDDLNIAFGGSLVGTTAYTTVEGETMRGVVHRMNGAEEQLPGGGVTLGGGTAGIRFDASEFSLTGADATTGFVAELSIDPQTAQADMATLFGAGGNMFVRLEAGALTYGFDSVTAGTWSKHRLSAPAPAAGLSHDLSVQYIRVGAGAQMHVSLDGVELAPINANAPAAINAAAGSSFGFGNDVHPAGGDRGYKGTLSRVRVASGLTAYAPEQNTFQSAPVTKNLLRAGFDGTLDGTAYAAGATETLDGSLSMRGGATVASGKLVLASAAQAADFTASESPFAGATLDTGFVTEIEFEADAAQKDLATLVAVGGNFSARYRNDGLQYGFSSNQSGAWVDHMGSAAVPATGKTHTLSLAYQPIEGGGAEVIAWLDGVELPKVSAADRSVRNTANAGTVTLGNEIPSIGGRGFIGSIDRARFALLTEQFSAKSFTFQQLKPVIPCADLGEIEPANYVSISADDCAENLTAKSAMVRPTDQQLRWQELALTGFVHFGINTFYNQEWGHGTEDPARFDPTGDVDVDGWMKTLRDSGHRMAILTLKHHDGFVLYPSRYTDYDVASTPWKDGKGDIVQEFTDAANKYGMKVGLYMSPADSHEEIDGRFGNGSVKSARTIPTLVEGDDRAGKDLPTFTYDATDYGAYFLNSLYEILTQYGEIDEVWFDGAAGNTAKQELFDYPAFYDLIGELQPNAVVAVGGNDVRWVGNEHGTARLNEWAPMAVKVPEDGGKIGVVAGGAFEQVGSAASLLAGAQSGANALHWWPTESDMKLTQGWFAHPNDVPKSGPTLLNHYLNTVGRNSVMLLNTPPTVNGSFAQASTEALESFAAERRKAFATDFALGTPVEAPDGSTAVLTDGNRRTSWQSESTTGTFTIDLGAAQKVTRIGLAEGVDVSGQTVDAFHIEAEVDGAWKSVGAAGTIGVSRIVTLDAPTTAQRFRVVIDSARAPFALAQLTVHPTLADDPGRLTEVWVDCTAEVAGGGSKERPFASLEQFRDVELAPGAAVHLRAGTSCADSDSPFWGYGTAEAPIVVDLYDGNEPPTFGDRTARDVFAPLETQGWQIAFSDVAPSVTLDGGSVKVGALASISVAGFPADATVTIGFEGTSRPGGEITTDADGAGSLTLRMAGNKPGTYTLVATGPDGTRAESEVVIRAGG